MFVFEKMFVLNAKSSCSKQYIQTSSSSTRSSVKDTLGNRDNDMGRQFGKLTTVRGIISYSISPFEQRAFAGAISKGLPNLWRRFAGQVFRVVPPLVLAYLVYDYGEKEHIRLMRKESNCGCEE